jgi:drug/metabolite transporter (DMT)-like permease
VGKVLVTELPPFTVVLGRVGLAALALSLLLLARRDLMPRDPKLWTAFLAMGLLNNVAPFTLIVFGETRISSGLASILNATTPVFTVLAAHVLAPNEKLSFGKGFGVLFGFLGVAVLIGPDALAGFGRGDLIGEGGACLLAALAYAFAVRAALQRHTAPQGRDRSDHRQHLFPDSESAARGNSLHARINRAIGSCRFAPAYSKSPEVAHKYRNGRYRAFLELIPLDLP